jgi:hypothetical protein
MISKGFFFSQVFGEISEKAVPFLPFLHKGLFVNKREREKWFQV